MVDCWGNVGAAQVATVHAEGGNIGAAQDEPYRTYKNTTFSEIPTREEQEAQPSAEFREKGSKLLRDLANSLTSARS